MIYYFIIYKRSYKYNKFKIVMKKIKYYIYNITEKFKIKKN